MKQYLTIKNILFAVCFISVIALLFLLFNQNKKPQLNTDAIKILQQQNEQLKQENEALKKQSILQQKRVEESKRQDSILIAKYEQRIWNYYLVIKKLNQKKDENNKAIDTATDNELRRYLSEAGQYFSE